MNKPLKYALFAFLLVALTVIVISVNDRTPAAHAQSSTATLSGWAWSSNIGWISFSGTGYSVSMNTTTPTSAPLSDSAFLFNF